MSQLKDREKNEDVIMSDKKTSDIRKLLASIKGPVPDNETTLDDIREEKWKEYEELGLTNK